MKRTIQLVSVVVMMVATVLFNGCGNGQTTKPTTVGSNLPRAAPALLLSCINLEARHQYRIA
jgi:uncharacterized lipoprotein YajG